MPAFAHFAGSEAEPGHEPKQPRRQRWFQQRSWSTDSRHSLPPWDCCSTGLLGDKQRHPAHSHTTGAHSICFLFPFLHPVHGLSPCSALVLHDPQLLIGVLVLTGAPFSPAGPGGPWGPGRPGKPMGPAEPAGPRSPGEPCLEKEGASVTGLRSINYMQKERNAAVGCCKCMNLVSEHV